MLGLCGEVVDCWELSFLFTSDSQPRWVLLPEGLLETYDELVHGAVAEVGYALTVGGRELWVEFDSVGFEDAERQGGDYSSAVVGGSGGGDCAWVLFGLL